MYDNDWLFLDDDLFCVEVILWDEIEDDFDVGEQPLAKTTPQIPNDTMPLSSS